MEELFALVVSTLGTTVITIYGILLMIGAPFGGPKLANRFAGWVWGSLVEASMWAIKLPFKTAHAVVFGRKKKKKRRG